MNNGEVIAKYAKKRSEEKVRLVISEIEKMVRNHEKITVYSVWNKTGVSKTFIYAHPEIMSIIDSYRHAPAPEPLPEETSEVVIAALKTEIKKLKEENKNLKKDGLWKEKYQHLREENKLLKERIEKLEGRLY